MRILVAVVLVGCAGDPEGPAKTPVTTPIPTTLSMFERLHDAAGAVAGLPGFRITHRVDPDHCGGLAVEAKRDVAAQVSADDAALADVLAIAFPTSLDFSEKTRAASSVTFNTWVEDMRARGAAARKTYSDRFLANDSTAVQRVVAAARIVQLQRHLASTVVRAEIPRDVRSGEYAGEKIEAFCDRLEEVAEPIVLAAEGAAKVCAEAAAKAGPGWWTRVCVITPGSLTASAAPSTSR